ncbi:MAG TPA: glycoside hydrolase family 15 protein, partial [Gammaproteobacteria bacterium]|nr:glycoside hydrolase family 15 protein [Gammaproteobacteria bacterium]
MSTLPRFAPGWPGIAARWTSSAKSGVGTALSRGSRLWFTLSHGIVNEVFYPRIDSACIRDMGCIVTDGSGFFSEEKRDATSAVMAVTDGVPAYKLVNTCRQGRYEVEKEIWSHPDRPALVQRTRFKVPEHGAAALRLFVLLSPHLGNRGAGNTAWVGDYKGVPMLFAERDGYALALACSAPWVERSAGFVGYSDGWQLLREHKFLTGGFTRAENGNVALTGEVDLRSGDGRFVLALAFGRNPHEAGNHARSTLEGDIDAAYEAYVQSWKQWQASLLPLDQIRPAVRNANRRNMYRVSTTVIRAHEAVDFPGGLIASLSVPWGFNKGDEDLGGYHLIWPRDLVEAAGALVAAGGHGAARRVLGYLQAAQEEDGHWGQNMWLDGSPYWNGIQMDETALPILLVDLALREKALPPEDVRRFWPMVRCAAGYLLRNGPVSQQDRW